MMTSGVPTEGPFATIVQCLRFVDCQMEYNAGQLTHLLRSLQGATCATRASFFIALCASRRRAQHGWSSRSVARIFTLEHELCILRQVREASTAFHAVSPVSPMYLPAELCLLRQISVMMRVRMLLHQRGLQILDSFRAFNASQNGLLTCSELYGALQWLGLAVLPADVYAMVKYMDKVTRRLPYLCARAHTSSALAHKSF